MEFSFRTLEGVESHTETCETQGIKWAGAAGAPAPVRKISVILLELQFHLLKTLYMV